MPVGTILSLSCISTLSALCSPPALCDHQGVLLELLFVHRVAFSFVNRTRNPKTPYKRKKKQRKKQKRYHTYSPIFWYKYL
ncbi:hypothetical protein FPQ18DRAFT_313026, partial [Pyronema domesticum]